jgi:hypothetical protein
MRYFRLVLILVACGCGHNDSPAGQYRAVNGNLSSALTIRRTGHFTLTLSGSTPDHRAEMQTTITGQWDWIGTSGVVLHGKHSQTKNGESGPDDTNVKMETVGTGGDLVITVGADLLPAGERFLKVSN